MINREETEDCPMISNPRSLENQRLKGQRTLGHRALIKLRRVVKWTSWHFTWRTRREPHIVFILGCQRSGTELLLRVFDRDRRTLIFGERSRLTADGGNSLRLKPWPEVNSTLSRVRAPFVIIKALVESQKARDVLRECRDCKLMWVYRHYRDVANSLVQRSERRVIRNLGQLLSGDNCSCHAENVSRETRAMVARYFHDEMSPYDAAALYWYARNVLYFEQALTNERDVLLLRYEQLVKKPELALQAIYSFVGLDYPGRHITAEVDSLSLGLGQDVSITRGIEELCQEMWGRLTASDSSRHNRTVAPDMW